MEIRVEGQYACDFLESHQCLESPKNSAALAAVGSPSPAIAGGRPWLLGFLGAVYPLSTNHRSRRALRFSSQTGGPVVLSAHFT